MIMPNGREVEEGRRLKGEKTKIKIKRDWLAQTRLERFQFNYKNQRVLIQKSGLSYSGLSRPEEPIRCGVKLNKGKLKYGNICIV